MATSPEFGGQLFDPDLREEEVDAYYGNIDKTDPRPVSYGLNSKLVRSEDEPEGGSLSGGRTLAQHWRRSAIGW